MVSLTPQTLARARAGQEAAVAAVLTHMMPLLRRLAARAVCPGLEFEDALQEGIIGLFGAIKTYHSAGGASFETYAAVCIRNAVTAARRAAAQIRSMAGTFSAPSGVSTPVTMPSAPARTSSAASSSIWASSQSS